MESLIAFINSPPIFYTRNGLAHGSDGNYSNLATDHYDDFSNFITSVIKHFADEKGEIIVSANSKGLKDYCIKLKSE